MRARIAEEKPEYDRWAIPLLASQTADGAITLGDSHEYGLDVDPFNKSLLDDLILREAAIFLRMPCWSIAERMNRVDEVMQLMQERGGGSYFGEPVSQLEHALQAAWFASQEGGAPELIAAALLHDIGHLLHDLGEGVMDEGVDTCHEEAGYSWVFARFGPGVAEPVRLHVVAKRYLCAVDSKYLASLSPASVQSLALQGGAFTEEQAREFEQLPGYDDAVRLRRWDDSAKEQGLVVPGLEEYRALLETLPAS